MTVLDINNINEKYINEYINDPSIYFEMLSSIKTTEYLNFLFTRINLNEIDINIQCNKTGKTLLMYAVQFNNNEYINKLIEKGAYLDIMDYEGNIARCYASKNKNWNIYNLLYNKYYKKYDYEENNKENYTNQDYSYTSSYSPPGSTGLNGYTISNSNGYINTCSNCNVSGYNMSYYK